MKHKNSWKENLVETSYLDSSLYKGTQKPTNVLPKQSTYTHTHEKQLLQIKRYAKKQNSIQEGNDEVQSEMQDVTDN